MSQVPAQSPVEDSVPKVGEVAVGEDLEFQRKWWRFEQIAWAFFIVILICDLLGLFGRGWLANAKRVTTDGAVTLRYERVERAGTPSIMTLEFGPAAIQNGRVLVFVSESIVKPLGAQRVAPQPMTSVVGEGGITYLFPSSGLPASVQIEMQPSFPGYHHFTVHVQGSQPVQAGILVLP